MPTPELHVIVARASNGAIGRNGQMPWHIPADLRHFKTTTMGAPVIMGRKTHQSIGRALPGRRNIVLTRDAHFAPAAGCQVCADLSQALRLCADASRVFVIGGDQIYRLALPLASCAWVTHVQAHVDDADAFFDDLNPAEWHKTTLSSVEATDTTPAIVFCRYDRIAAP